MSDYIQRKRNSVLRNVCEKQEWLSMYNKSNLVIHNYGSSKFNSPTQPSSQLLSNSIGNSLNSSLNVALFDKLAGISQETSQLVYNFSIGNFEYISTHLTDKQCHSIRSKLNETNSANFNTVNTIYNSHSIGTYNEIRTFIMNSMEGLMHNLSQYNNLQNAMKLYLEAKKYEDILNDKIKLQEYLNKLYLKNQPIFPDVTVSLTVAPEIDPAYDRYFDLYGPPDGGVFDEQLLSEIRAELGLM